MITAGPDGNLWFTESGADKIGRITPSGAITEFPLPFGGSPAGIAAGSDGSLWFTESGAKEIGRITTGGKVVQFPVPTKTGTGAIAAGPSGDIWFTAGSEIGSISPSGQTTQPSASALIAVFPLSLAGGPRRGPVVWLGYRNHRRGRRHRALGRQRTGKRRQSSRRRDRCDPPPMPNRWPVG